MHSRDLFLGLFLIVGAGWIATAAPLGGGPAFTVATVGCALAGAVYLVAGAELGVGTTVAGTTITRLRYRAVSQALLGVSMLALGVGGYLEAGDILSAGIGLVGLLVLGLSGVLWVTGGADAGAGEVGAT
ncbi:hypothetical protein JCM17823_12090 [Halorubrum gandharaense]